MDTQLPMLRPVRALEEFLLPSSSGFTNFRMAPGLRANRTRSTRTCNALSADVLVDGDASQKSRCGKHAPEARSGRTVGVPGSHDTSDCSRRSQSARRSSDDVGFGKRQTSKVKPVRPRDDDAIHRGHRAVYYDPTMPDSATPASQVTGSGQ